MYSYHFKKLPDFPDRKATWLELFFDLVFVVAVSTLSHILANKLSFRTIEYFIFLFIPVWWIWMGFSYYADQFEKDDLIQRIALFLAMFGVIVLANTIPDVLDGHITHFVIAYVMLRLLLITLYLIAWKQHERFRKLIFRYVLGFSLAVFVWLSSIVFPFQYHIFLWGFALFIELTIPMLAYLTIKNVPAHVSHMDERFGLFTLIMLGDTIVAVAVGIEKVHWVMSGVINCVVGFFCAIAMWKLYFDDAEDKLIHRALRGSKIELFRSFLYGYSHFLVFAGVVSFGVGIVLAAREHTILLYYTRLILFLSPAIYIIGLTLIHFTAHKNSLVKLITVRSIAIGILIISAFFLQNILLHYAMVMIGIIFGLLMIAERIVKTRGIRRV